ncbi:MAG: HAMP domain-containing sensor histidine kinase, partial [Phycisphaerales bacterium]
NEQFLTEFESSAQSLLNAYTDMHLILTSDQRAAFGSQLLEINGDKFDFRQVVKISPGADANLYFTDYRNSLENKFPMNDVLGRLTHLVQTENCSLKMADKFKWSDFEKPSKDRIYSIPNDVYFYSVLDTGKLHCVIFRTSRFPMETESIFQTLFLMKVGNKFISEDFNIWITGMPGARPKGEMLLEMPLSSQYSPDLKIALYPKNDNFLVEFAGKRKLMYLWTVSIVIIAMLSVTALAGRNIFRQAKFNKLKNDFIATITHELKTPLSSMRVLVDTLLEGKCKDKQHETEYLQLISKENARLSRLIDNFLTFSRMERNKQVFDFCPVSPAEIAKAAAEAVHAKFENAGVNFKVDIAKPLPTIIADKDAITTVLVNLLDNAYKYSYDNKQIELKVFLENSDICFAVKDNGIGLTGRQMKKIFERFYQVDTSLSRRAEGAGLGLSIIKFIVDAHKGKINVESKIGKGSQFSVMLTTNKY